MKLKQNRREVLGTIAEVNALSSVVEFPHHRKLYDHEQKELEKSISSHEKNLVKQIKESGANADEVRYARSVFRKKIEKFTR